VFPASRKEFIVSEPLRVLAIHAHPDDIEFQCSGTLMLLAAAGCHLTIASMCPGDKGSAELGPMEISRVRREEARAAARIIGADCHCLEFRDLEIVHDNPSRRRVTEFLRQVRPDLVLTAPPIDYMADHEITGKLVRDACFNVSVPNYDTGVGGAAKPLAKMPWLYYMDAVEGLDWYGNRQPVDFQVDVTTVWERKRDSFACHASQRNWLRQQHGIDEYMNAVERWSRARGEEAGVPHAEGFRQHRGHPFPTSNRLAELLGGFVRPARA
jgi:LmbE family N-acetylglucosaminyl deacetylase